MQTVVSSSLNPSLVFLVIQQYFTRALAVEYGPKGVHFQVQVPLFVTTKLAKIKRASLFVPNPTTYARSAVAAIGHDSLGSVTPYWPHAIQLWALKSLPEVVSSRMLLSMHSGIRKAGMKKAEREKNL